METYTLTLNKQQKDLITKALESFAQLHVGQTLHEQEAAKKFEPHFKKTSHYSSNNLSELDFSSTKY